MSATPIKRGKPSLYGGESWKGKGDTHRLQHGTEEGARDMWTLCMVGEHAKAGGGEGRGAGVQSPKIMGEFG